MLLLAHIAMSGAMGGTSATAREAPIAHTLDQLTSGSARYALALSYALSIAAVLTSGFARYALDLSYALAIAAAVAAAHAAIEEQERRTLEALNGLGDGGSPGEPEQHAAVEELERRAHEALDGLDGSDRRDDAPPETGPASSMLPGGGYEISSDNIPFGNTLEPDRPPTLEPDRLSFAAAVAATATHVLHPEGETPTSAVAVAAAVATGGEPVEPEQHAAADKPEQCALGEFNRLDGNAYATAAAEPSGRADESLQGSANELEQRAHGDLDVSTPIHVDLPDATNRCRPAQRDRLRGTARGRAAGACAHRQGDGGRHRRARIGGRRRRRRTRARRVYTNRAFGGDGFESLRVAAVTFLVLYFPGTQYVAGGGVRNLV